MSSAVDGLAGELVRGLEVQASVGAVAVVVPQPVAHGDGDIFVVVELIRHLSLNSKDLLGKMSYR